MTPEDDPNTEFALVTQAKLDHYYSIDRGMHFAHVENFVLRQSDEYGGFGDTVYIDIQLQSLIPSERRSLYLTFSDVADLRFVTKPNMVIYFSCLEIRVQSGSEWDRTYAVSETDDDIISFTCSDFTAEVK